MGVYGLLQGYLYVLSMMFREIIVAYCEIHAKDINTLLCQDAVSECCITWPTHSTAIALL
jgi:hypothetical protein